jgi:hypothetical protein
MGMEKGWTWLIDRSRFFVKVVSGTRIVQIDQLLSEERKFSCWSNVKFVGAHHLVVGEEQEEKLVNDNWICRCVVR